MKDPISEDTGAIKVARAHYRARRLPQAEAACRDALVRNPDDPDALELMGLLANSAGRRAEAVALVQKAIALNPSAANYHNDFGLILAGQERAGEAITAFEQAIALRPDYAEAHNNIGTLLRSGGGGNRLEEAAAACRRAIVIKPDFAEAHFNLANVLTDQGRPDEAIAAYQRAITLRPRFGWAHGKLADRFRETGRHRDAITELRRLVELQPDCAEAWNDLNVELQIVGEMEEAVAAGTRAVALQPKLAEAHYHLGNALAGQRLADDAIASYRRAIALRPDFAEAHANLGVALKDTGELDEAIACTRRAIQIAPDPLAASSLLRILHYPADCDPKQLLEEHLRWNELYARPLAKSIRPHTNDPSPGRRLRIGYVSADFDGHPVGCCLLPVLAHHDHKGFEIICYDSTRCSDGVTERLRRRADVWRAVAGASDEQLAQIIREDRVDVLVDLSVHTNGNRLLAFARKPAPVQVTWLGWPGTTGLDAMDYRLSDPYLDPPPAAAGPQPMLYSEQTVRLPHSFWCHGPLSDQPPVNELPAMGNGFVTFGSFNNFCKVTGLTVELWAEVLSRNAGSRMLVLAPPGLARERVTGQLRSKGIDPGRVEFVGRVPQQQYLELYQRIDVCLDTVPYAGHTTSMDSFWMGVPVVSLVGALPVWRAGLSIASNLGLAELAARTAEEYVSIACGLAADLPRLAGLRASLRARMEASPIMDAPRYARDLENAFRGMWRKWCNQ